MDIHTYNYDSARPEGQNSRGGVAADAGLQLFSTVQPDSDTSSSKNILGMWAVAQAAIDLGLPLHIWYNTFYIVSLKTVIARFPGKKLHKKHPNN
jgi:hypothetical protein